MTLLVTGAAGFIGSHVAMALLDRGEQVVGIDNLNDYYDPALKLARIDRLKALRRGSASTAISQQSHVIAAESTQTAPRLALLMRSRLPIVSILS